jgi:RimJ/RimL family protein N-acetyltransferase
MPEVNLGYALHPCAWGKGLGFELCSRILEVAFVDLQLPEVIAVIDPRNTTSRRLAAKCGLHLWKHRKWKGLRRVVYRILRREYTHRIAEHAGA